MQKSQNSCKICQNQNSGAKYSTTYSNCQKLQNLKKIGRAVSEELCTLNVPIVWYVQIQQRPITPVEFVVSKIVMQYDQQHIVTNNPSKFEQNLLSGF